MNQCIIDICEDNSAEIKILKLPMAFSVMEYFQSTDKELAKIDVDLSIAEEHRAEFLRKAKSFIDQHYADFHKFDSILCSEQENIAIQDRYFQDNHEIKTLTIGCLELKHSVSWYLYARIDQEISLSQDKLICAKELGGLTTNVEKIIMILRENEIPENAEKELERAFDIAYTTSDFIVNKMTLSELVNLNKEELISKETKTQLQLDFLRFLKS